MLGFMAVLLQSVKNLLPKIGTEGVEIEERANFIFCHSIVQVEVKMLALWCLVEVEADRDINMIFPNWA